MIDLELVCVPSATSGGALELLEPELGILRLVSLERRDGGSAGDAVMLL